MKSYTLEERTEFYKKAFPDWPPPRVDGRWLSDQWFFGVDGNFSHAGMTGLFILGNDYRTKARDSSGKPFYGAYPPNYVERVMALYPDAEDVLHLFSGAMPYSPSYVRFGNKIEPPLGISDFEGDAHALDQFYANNRFDLVMADPPYSPDDAKKYDMPYLNHSTVLAQIHKVMRIGGTLVWLDTKWPMHSKDQWQTYGFIGIVRSTNHRYRIATFMRKV